nr:immunoglobulin light chain junction region [Macaca mulatta]MOX42284.1 immunoglobulin light chain junction region [Macaca mulatta]MOX42352.1 immunoglobulin light chain junction region [Macaca mulatta]MOX42683.1 immunoglobulin light chain junction region [Macaca mulatta]MOX42915.1 immunoglobulin light chain junction region [Macaca mulatta]
DFYCYSTDISGNLYMF